MELIKFFDMYPLITQKKADYLFKEIILIIQKKTFNCERITKNN